MRKWIWIFVLMFAPLLRAQVSNPSILPVASEPANCPVLPMYYVASTNALYGGNGSNTCQQVNTSSSGTFNALTGDASSTSTGGATTVLGINGTLLSGLATGLLKNTTATGVPSVAAAGTDYVAPGGALGTPSSGVITNLTGTCGSCVAHSAGSVVGTVNGNTYPSSAGFTAGGIWGASSTSAATMSAYTANGIPKMAGTATTPVVSSMIDNGTTVTSTDTGGFVAPVLIANGTTAGFMDFTQGTTSAAVAPCNVANSICWMAPTSVTSQLRVLASSPATGFPLYTNSSGTMTETITGTQGTLSAGPFTFGGSAVNTVIAQTIAPYAGHFTNLVMTSSLGGGTCTTDPTFNIFDGTTNTGTAKLSTSTTQTKGTATNQSQTLTFAAGDLIGIYISTAGGTCTLDTWTVEAQYSTP